MNTKCDFCNDDVAEWNRQHNKQIKYIKYKYNLFANEEEVIEGNACFDCYEFITSHDEITVVK